MATFNCKTNLKEQGTYHLFIWTYFKEMVNYSNEDIDIISHTEGTRHNTITPIARKKGDNYEMNLVFRNNRTTEEYPLGIFHPHQELHHIKKENIGLIEVMGLAVLPARLKDELTLLEKCLINETDINDYESLEKHKDWFEEIKNKNGQKTMSKINYNMN